jgi:hypothetical protein
MRNLTDLTEDGKIGLAVPQGRGSYWMEIFTHLLEEHSLRGNAFPPGVMKGAPLPKTTWPQAPRALALLREAKFDAAHHIVKFGKSEYLRRCPQGRWRITAASWYKDPSLGPARQDSELERTVYGLQNEVEVTILDQQNGRPVGKTRPIGNLTVTQRSMTDYFVMCLAKSLALRLFDDFDRSDSCVIIRNVREFARRIFLATRKMLPGWSGKLRDVTYYDPFNPPRDRDVFFSKHFRYAYQQEVRFVWLPPQPELDLKNDFIDISAGSMADICDFFILPKD